MTVVRVAQEHELERVNELRHMVNDLHVENRPDIFKQGWGQDISNAVYEMWKSEDHKIIVAEHGQTICGFACIHFIEKSETAYRKPLRYIEVSEFGVDPVFRRKGIATELMEFIFDLAKETGISRIELNMWDFNESALAFYESVGFRTYRRIMEAKA